MSFASPSELNVTRGLMQRCNAVSGSASNFTKIIRTATSLKARNAIDSAWSLTNDLASGPLTGKRLNSDEVICLRRLAYSRKALANLTLPTMETLASSLCIHGHRFSAEMVPPIY